MYHHWGYTSIHGPLSYPFRSLIIAFIKVENSDSDEDLIETVTTILYDNQDENEQSHNKHALNEPENVKANQFEVILFFVLAALPLASRGFAPRENK